MKRRSFPNYVDLLILIVSIAVGFAVELGVGSNSISGRAFGCAAGITLCSILIAIRWAAITTVFILLQGPEIRREVLQRAAKAEH